MQSPTVTSNIAKLYNFYLHAIEESNLSSSTQYQKSAHTQQSQSVSGIHDFNAPEERDTSNMKTFTDSTQLRASIFNEFFQPLQMLHIHFKHILPVSQRNAVIKRYSDDECHTRIRVYAYEESPRWKSQSSFMHWRRGRPFSIQRIA